MSKRVTILLVNKTYYLRIDNRIIFTQPIIPSLEIPPRFSAATYWYFYVVLIAQRLGLYLPPLKPVFKNKFSSKRK